MPANKIQQIGSEIIHSEAEEFRKELEQRLAKLCFPEFYDFNLSSQLTKAVRSLDSGFKDDNVLIISRKDDQDHKHVLNADAYFQFIPNSNVIKIDCSRAAKILQEVSENPKLIKLRDGIRLIVYHELGHQKLPLRYRASETMAHLYALDHVDDPISASASVLAMSRYIDSSESIKEQMNKWLYHLSDDRDDYSLPLRESAVEHITKRAEFFYKILKDHLDPKYLHMGDTYAS